MDNQVALIDNASLESLQLALGTASLLVITFSKREHFKRKLGFLCGSLGAKEIEQITPTKP